MRRGVVLAPLVFLLFVASAWADEVIEAGPTCCRFSAASYTMDQGEKLSFTNNDLTGPRHDVKSFDRGPDGTSPLFGTAEIGTGQTAFVEGSQYLTTGEYRFLCTLHNGMESKLVVSASGTPTPRPVGGGSTVPPDSAPPQVKLEVAKTMRAKSLAKSRKIATVVEIDERAPVTLTAFLGSKKIGSVKGELTPQVPTDLQIRVSKKNAKLLKKGKKLKLVASARDAAGNTGEASLTKTLR